MNANTLQIITDTTLFKGSKVKHDSGTECCLSLCQAVSFLPAAEEDEEMMMRKEDGHGKGKYICIFIIIVLIRKSYKQLYHNCHQMV